MQSSSELFSNLVRTLEVLLPLERHEIKPKYSRLASAILEYGKAVQREAEHLHEINLKGT